MVIDRKEHITYSIMTEGTLSGVPKKKNRENPHYLQSVLYVENKDCIAKERQMTLEDFGITIFDTDVLEQDFKKISQGMINVEEDYKHYIIAYKAENGEIKDIKLRFLDKDFNMKRLLCNILNQTLHGLQILGLQKIQMKMRSRIRRA